MQCVKRCSETELKRVFELDYAKFMGLSEVRNKKQPTYPKHNSKKRSFGDKGGNPKKKYRRF